ncbi:MAG: hypothetical protein GY832_32795 [Chloroflexi bacterium]|nr:hypothetical protein [Chloroflexota bacterium]
MGTSDANHFQEGKQMTAGYGLAGAPSSRVIYMVAPSVYREVVMMCYDYLSGSYRWAFEWLERSDAKVSRAVLRGLGASNGPWLPDRLTPIHTYLQERILV